LDRLAASRADILAISARIKKLDAQIPALLKAMGCSLTPSMASESSPR